jgi:hypothetical protein
VEIDNKSDESFDVKSELNTISKLSTKWYDSSELAKSIAKGKTKLFFSINQIDTNSSGDSSLGSVTLRNHNGGFIIKFSQILSWAGFMCKPLLSNACGGSSTNDKVSSGCYVGEMGVNGKHYVITIDKNVSSMYGSIGPSASVDCQPK